MNKSTTKTITTKGFRKIRILLADDNKESTKYFLLSLINADKSVSIVEREKMIHSCYDVTIINDYKIIEEKYFKAVQKESPDIIFLDLNFEKNSKTNTQEDLTLKGIEIADKFMQLYPSSKVILNTAWADLVGLDKLFKERGINVVDKYSPTDSPNTIYRKQKSGTTSSSNEVISHLVTSILFYTAVYGFTQMEASSKSNLLKYLSKIENKNEIDVNIAKTLYEIEIALKSSSGKIRFVDLFYSNAVIIRNADKTTLQFSNLADTLQRIVDEANKVNISDHPVGNGPYKIEKVRSAFLNYFSEERTIKIEAIKEKVKVLCESFLRPVLKNKPFASHGYMKNYSIASAKKNSSITDSITFQRKLENNITVRTSLVLISNLIISKSTSNSAYKTNPLFKYHKKVFKLFIDGDFETIALGKNHLDYGDDEVKPWANSILGLKFRKDERAFKKDDLCKIELLIYDEIYPALNAIS